jgi:hypothetical protein
MTSTEIALETFVYSPFDHLTRLLAREYFIEFSRRESFQLCKNSTVMKLGTCIADALRHLYVKCYCVKVFIVDCSLSVELKNHSFLDIRFMWNFSSFWVKNWICPRTLGAPCIGLSWPRRNYHCQFCDLACQKHHTLYWKLGPSYLVHTQL